MEKIKLFCLPYAGGSSAAFNRWRPLFDPNIEMRPLELAGRGKRIYDPFYQNVEEAIDDIFRMIKDEILQNRYAIYGHSMGNLFGYELAYKIREMDLPAPVHMFLSGRGAPDVPLLENEIYHHLPDEEFKQKIVELGGTPKEFLEHPELLEVLLPMIRSDFSLAETYVHRTEIIPFDFDLTIMMGKEEDVTAEQMFAWKNHTNGLCSIHYFEGDHFFIHKQTDRLVGLINRTLADLSR